MTASSLKGLVCHELFMLDDTSPMAGVASQLTPVKPHAACGAGEAPRSRVESGV
jgi:hypothetical protein